MRPCCVSRPRTRGLDHNPVEATDPVGDSNGAPDITGVTVANDLSGTILFVVEVANRTGFAANDDVLIYIDSDRSAATGYPDRGGGGRTTCSGSTRRASRSSSRGGTGPDSSLPQRRRCVAWANGYVAIINHAELGATSDFAFFVRTRLKGGATAVRRRAGGRVPRLHAGPAAHRGDRAAVLARAPRAGSTFRLHSVELPFETAERGAAATFTCRATLAGETDSRHRPWRLHVQAAEDREGQAVRGHGHRGAAGGKAETFPPYAFRVR